MAGHSTQREIVLTRRRDGATFTVAAPAEEARRLAALKDAGEGLVGLVAAVLFVGFFVVLAATIAPDCFGHLVCQ